MDEGLDGKVCEMELELAGNGNYERYLDLIKNAGLSGKSETFTNMRYAMALANSFNNSGGEDQYMFVGGLGVVGNALRHVTEEEVIEYRNIHDIDVVIRSRPYEYVVTDFFDKINQAGCSLSIPGKLVISGDSSDSEGHSLPKIDIDAYIPNGDPRVGVNLNSINFDYFQWESRKQAEFLGIPFNVANPMALLYLKLDITTGKKGLRRVKDCQDIATLLGVLEADQCPPSEVYHGLTLPRLDKLKEIYSNECKKCSTCGFKECKPLVTPSRRYIDSIFKLAEEENGEKKPEQPTEQGAGQHEIKIISNQRYS